MLRPIINATLMTRAATARSVESALNLDAVVVESYCTLFFNVLDRKNDVAYVRKLLGGGGSSARMVSCHTTPSDEEVLLPSVALLASGYPAYSKILTTLGKAEGYAARIDAGQMERAHVLGWVANADWARLTREVGVHYLSKLG